MRRCLPFLYALFFLIACQGAVELTEPDVTYTVMDDGGGLTLTWSEVEDAEGYYVYADDAIVDTVEAGTDASYDMTTPAAVVTVTAYSGEDEGEAWTGDFTPVETDLTIYGLADPDPAHPSGLGFSSTGTGIGYTVQDPANYSLIDFVFDDLFFPNLNINSPDDPNYNQGQGYNDEMNFSYDHGTTDYDGITAAAAPGVYSAYVELATGGVYSGWIDPDGNNWDTDDNFMKMKVEAISGSMATIKVAYQPEGGLRWLVTAP